MSSDLKKLTRREREIMDIVYRLGQASAAQVRQRLSDTPSYSSVRAMLAKLERKGYLRHRQDGPKYIFHPTLPREAARQNAMSRLVETFFDGSVSQAINGLLGLRGQLLSAQELDELVEQIERARKEGR